MNSKLTKRQQRTICSQLGRVKLQLLYKAIVHGFTAAGFHQRCDQHSPTVSVGFNTSGYVFGGYTKQPFSQSGLWVRDDRAFLFTFSGEKLLKYPVINPANAVNMNANSGPYFGNALVLANNNQAVVYSNPEQHYIFNAAEMHGNDLTLTECEVYQVEAADHLSTMDSKLTRSHQRSICSQLGRVKLQLLYKASVHGFTVAAFHQRCDNQGPTVSVGFNASGYVFGGYTKQPFSQSGQYVRDDQAFLFTFSGKRLLKYLVTGPANAVQINK